jgi:hypothetical protein
MHGSLVESVPCSLLSTVVLDIGADPDPAPLGQA